MKKKPGELDVGYGNNGVSIIPAEVSMTDETYTLQVKVCVKNPVDDSMVFVGHNPPLNGSGEVPLRPLFFTCIDKNGKWDEGRRHVALPETGMEEYGIIRSVSYITLDGRGRYLASFLYRYQSGGNIVYHAAIHAFDEAFKPILDFGNNGMVYLKNPDYPESRGSDLPSSEPRAPDYRFEHKVDLVDGKIKIIFSGMVNSLTDHDDANWCALLNPYTGELVAGLGENKNQSQIALPTVHGIVFHPYRVEILKDGSFLIVCYTTDQHGFYLMRFNSNATLDKSFGDGGQIHLPGKPLNVGLAVFKDTIVVSTAPFAVGSAPTQLYGFDLAGRTLPHFTKEIRVPSRKAKGKKNVETGTSLHHIKFDTSGRLVLAGYIVDENKESFLQLARLKGDGAFDTSFGEGGFSDPKLFYYLFNSHGLHLKQDAINVFSWTLKSLTEFHERFSQFTA